MLRIIDEACSHARTRAHGPPWIAAQISDLRKDMCELKESVIVAATEGGGVCTCERCCFP